MKLLLDFCIAILFRLGVGIFCAGSVKLGGLVLDFTLENGDVFSQSFLGCVRPSCLALEVGYPRPHLLILNLPGIPVSLVTVPFRLQKPHDAL